ACALTKKWQLAHEAKQYTTSLEKRVHERTEELKYQANHDLLTGLPNRVLLLESIRETIEYSNKNNKLFGILFFDLDRFKLINDSLSHEAGDEVLRIISKRLQAVLREEDLLARLGGDEFVVLIKDVKDKDIFISLASNLLSIFEKPIKIQNHEIKLTSSVGISIYPKDGKNVDILLRNADTAMYRAKELGANQFQFYTEELNARNIERLEKEAELRRALANEEFFLCYQPQYDLKTETLVSVEALIRWQHPTKGVVSPIDFVPLAEDTGLIVPIGEWVLRTACRQVKAWQDMGLMPIRVAVNVTTKQFKLYNLVQIVRTILEETQLESKYLELELTENIIINNADIVKTIYDLKEMGIQIVLDDFGTGYSSLNYLRELPIDRLKIDQSYVQNIESNRGDDVIIQAIIAMAQSLNLEVLAEGVESESQLEFLKKSKCGEVQGFYFSKPIPAKTCERLLREPHNLKLAEELEEK
ncbi:MAG: EAL domain-containing protein, partial [Gammaproteobacteria bacterium]